VHLVGVKELTLHPLATSPWSLCDAYGQVAVSSIAFEAAPTKIDFNGACPATWGIPAVAGGVYGGKPYSEFCLVWEPTCTAETKSASVNLAFAGGEESITISHLDGMSNLDSFDLLVDDVVIGHYSDSLNPSESWVVTPFAVNVAAGIHTVKLTATNDAWAGCDSWGQLAVDYIEECTPLTFYQDSDGDGYGNSAATIKACSVPTGYVADSTDCNDADAAVHPGATEICNGKDDDCNAGTVDGSSEAWFNQGTSCGVGVCASTGAFVCTGVKTDTCTEGSPTGTDNNCNGIDEDCSGTADNNYVPVTSCFLPGVCSASNAASTCVAGVETACHTGSPTAETCDNLDNDCDGTTDESLTRPTANQAGLCDGNKETCSAGIYTPRTTNYQPATETCDNKDNDCDGKTDESPCTAAIYCGNINIRNTGDFSGMIKCTIADWQDNEHGRFPNDCRVNLVRSGRSFKAVCVAAPNAN
jgi:hypothetical protein